MKKLYITAAIFALLTALAVFGFTKKIENNSKISYTQIVVAAEKIPARTVVTTEMLTLKEIPAEAVHPYAIYNIEDAVGRLTDSKIEVGEYVLASKLHKQGDKSSGLKYFVPEGKRAITIQVDSVSGVGGFILPGDRIDIMASMLLKKAGSSEQTPPTSLMLVQNLEVLACGTNIKENSDGTSSTYSNITLAVTPDDALLIYLADINGSLRLLLRSPIDDKIENLNPKTPVLNGNVVG